jgi:hypothetical protein
MKARGFALIALALVVGIVPYFTNCAHDGEFLTLADGRQVPMKCYWTAMAEVALAAPLLGLGALLTFSKRKETTRSLALLGTALGAFVVLLPTALIGVCGMLGASCNLIMRPSLIFAGALVMGISLISLVFAPRTAEQIA